MTDYQVIRRKITHNCITSLDEKIRKNRLNQEEIRRIIFAEVAKVIEEVY